MDDLERRVRQWRDANASPTGRGPGSMAIADDQVHRWWDVQTLLEVIDRLRDERQAPGPHPAAEATEPPPDDGPCWLCEGRRAIAVHITATEQQGRTLWVAHAPESKSHPTYPCPACTDVGPSDG